MKPHTYSLQQYYELPGQPGVFIQIDQLTPKQAREIAASLRKRAKAHHDHADALGVYLRAHGEHVTG